ncbi:hypothetical protein [Paenibacillus sp. AGC30]
MSNFDCIQDDESNMWLIPMNICSLGGCYFNFLELDTEVEARDKAKELTDQGKKMTDSTPCDSCYNDHMQSCE